MKKCPQCGFVPTLSNKRMLRLFADHFPDLPVMEMIHRQWINIQVYSQWQDRSEWHEDEIPQMLEQVLKELIDFFNVPDVEELKVLLAWQGDLMDKQISDPAANAQIIVR